MNSTTCIDQATCARHFKLVAVLSENIYTNAANDLGRSGESSFKNIDLQTFVTISDGLYFPMFWRSSYPSDATPFLSLPFEIAYCSPLRTSQLTSSVPPRYASGTTLSYMLSLSLLYSPPASKIHRFQVLDWSFFAPAHCMMSLSSTCFKFLKSKFTQ